MLRITGMKWIFSNRVNLIEFLISSLHTSFHLPRRESPSNLSFQYQKICNFHHEIINYLKTVSYFLLNYHPIIKIVQSGTIH